MTEKSNELGGSGLIFINCSKVWQYTRLLLRSHNNTTIKIFVMMLGREKSARGAQFNHQIVLPVRIYHT